MNPYILLAGAIVSEVAGTLSLKSSEGFSRFGPAVLVVVGYGASFILLGLALNRGLPVGAGYAIWAATGTTLVAVAGVLLFGEKFTRMGVLGIVAIIVGVVLLQLGQRHTT